jgi:hypothetical protein
MRKQKTGSPPALLESFFLLRIWRRVIIVRKVCWQPATRVVGPSNQTTQITTADDNPQEQRLPLQAQLSGKLLTGSHASPMTASSIGIQLRLRLPCF